ncbi:DUF58 domain-containing protein [Luedemannella flava]|uniref:DUF58 domain-containing protein n=1 Tax=Luedemannella flava TaxID=349316 RepID=A0ABP4YJR8_9ACTN
MITWRVAVLLGVLGGGAVAVAAVLEAADPDAGSAWLWWTLLGIVVLVAVAAVADWAAAVPPAQVRLGRSGATQVRLGESATVRLTVTNRSARRLRAVVRDAWVPSAGATGPYAHDVDAGPGQTRAIDTVLVPTRRGDRPAARVTVRSYGPAGLAYRQTGRRLAAKATPPWTLTALPPFTSRRFLPEKLSRLRVIDGQVVTRGRGQGTEFDSLRDYVIGDDVRSIDWRGSARRVHLAVKQWRPERDRRVLCVLDTGRTSAGRVGTVAAQPVAGVVEGGPAEGESLAGEPRLDAAIDAALLLAALASHADDRVDLLACDTVVRASVSTSVKRSVLPRLTKALAGLQPALVETDFGRVVAEVLRLERKRALVVLFTTLDPGALGEGLLPVLPQLVAKHTVIVAAVHDPSLEVLAARRDNARDLHTAAAAEKALAELARVRSALSRAGVQVVDSPADRFASDVADLYLALKAAGRL